MEALKKSRDEWKDQATRATKSLAQCTAALRGLSTEELEFNKKTAKSRSVLDSKHDAVKALERSYYFHSKEKGGYG